MKTTWINQAKKIFQEAQIPIQSGLSQRQLSVLEKLMGNIVFPPDYHQLLTQFVPTNRHHNPTDWRHLLSQPSIQPFLDNTYSIIEQSCHATIVNFNGWQPDWGPYPNDKTQRWKKAKAIIKKAPPIAPRLWTSLHQRLPSHPWALRLLHLRNRRYFLRKNTIQLHPASVGA